MGNDVVFIYVVNLRGKEKISLDEVDEIKGHLFQGGVVVVKNYNLVKNKLIWILNNLFKKDIFIEERDNLLLLELLNKDNYSCVS
jgi:hypothetical protein